MDITLHRLEGVKDPHAGGVLIRYGTGRNSLIEWQGDGRLILPTLGAAKRYVAEVIAALGPEAPEVQAVNWVSVIAAVQRHIEDWNMVQRSKWASTEVQDVSTH